MDFQSSKCQPHEWCLGENDFVSQKNLVTSLTTERTLDDEQFHTFLKKAESILNSRSLSPITTEVDGLEPWTPNYLLKLCPTGNVPPSLPSNKNCFAKKR